MFDRDTTPAFAGSLSGTDYGIFAVSFVAILLIAVLASLCFLDWRAWFPGARSRPRTGSSTTSHAQPAPTTAAT